MKKTIYLYKYNELNKYKFKRLSILDCQKILKKIDSKMDVRYYQEIEQDNDGNLYAINKGNYGDKFRKKLHTMDTGNDGFISCDDFSKIGDYSIDKLLDNFSLQISFNIHILGIFYDDDWQAIISIPNEKIENIFLKLLYKRFNIVQVDNLEFFRD